MTLKDLMKVLPAYTTVHVHDEEGSFARKGNPHDFVVGAYKSSANDLVSAAIPIGSYLMEVTVYSPDLQRRKTE